MSEENNIDGIWGDDSTIPESNWFEFNKVGDAVAGELLQEPFDKPGKFGLQKIYVLRDSKGKEWNVSLKAATQKLQIQQLRSADVGDIIAFRFNKEVDTGKVNPAKSIEVRIRHANKEA